MLSISGTALLDGTLDISLNFAPGSGAKFEILTAATVDSNLSLAGDAADFVLNNLGSSLVLEYIGSGSISDLNGNGAVDASDAGEMFSNWGGIGTGDVNSDNVVDAADAGVMFSEWTGDAALNFVPEPALATTFSSMLIAIVLQRRRRAVR